MTTIYFLPNTTSPSRISEFPCLRKYLHGLNISELIINEERENFCQFHTTIYAYTNFVFLHINPILLVILIVISLFGNIKENYKWIIIHSSMLNLFMTFIFMFGYWKRVAQTAQAQRPEKNIAEEKQISSIFIYMILLAGTSMLPLTLNRFCFLYFQTFYHKVFTKFGLFLFILSYDIYICMFYFISGLLGLRLMLALGKFGIMFIDLILSILLIRKIQTMQKMAYTSTFKKITIRDLYRISILCSLQASFYIIFLILSFLKDLFINFHYINLYLSVFIHLGAIYQMMISVDSLLLLFLLKSYRIALIRFVKMFCEKFCGLFKDGDPPSTPPQNDTSTILLPNNVVTTKL